MQLNEKQSKEFIQWYEQRYCKPGETLMECSARLIEQGIVADEEKEYEAWKDFFANILGNKSNKIYKHRISGPETILSKVLNTMRMAYGPKILSDL